MFNANGTKTYRFSSRTPKVLTSSNDTSSPQAAFTPIDSNSISPVKAWSCKPKMPQSSKWCEPSIDFYAKANFLWTKTFGVASKMDWQPRRRLMQTYSTICSSKLCIIFAARPIRISFNPNCTASTLITWRIQPPLELDQSLASISHTIENRCPVEVDLRLVCPVDQCCPVARPYRAHCQRCTKIRNFLWPIRCSQFHRPAQWWTVQRLRWGKINRTFG